MRTAPRQQHRHETWTQCLWPVTSDHCHSSLCCSLRTSETNYLNEAFSFYAAIRGRGYYSKATKEERSDLMVKKLRYYARFIVVCLLLKKMKLVRDLVRELAKHIEDYSSTYEPDDQLEWSLVLSEIKSFIDVRNHPSRSSPRHVTPCLLSHRPTMWSQSWTSITFPWYFHTDSDSWTRHRSRRWP